MSENKKFLVFSNPVEGREDEYNDWYDKQHLADVCAIPGVTGASRYEIAQLDPSATPAHKYLAVYEMEGEPADVFAQLSARAGTDLMPMSEALDLATIGMSIWVPRSNAK
jgi:hypothetical protein